MSTMSVTGELEFAISNLRVKGIKYGIMYTEASNIETNPAKWTFFYSGGRVGTISGLKSKTDYNFVSFGMGTETTLVYSDPVTISAL